MFNFVDHLRIANLPEACRGETQEVWETLPSKEASNSKQQSNAVSQRQEISLLAPASSVALPLSSMWDRACTWNQTANHTPTCFTCCRGCLRAAGFWGVEVLSMNTLVFTERLKNLFSVVSCGMIWRSKLFHVLWQGGGNSTFFSFEVTYFREFTVCYMGKLISVLFVRYFIPDFCCSSPSI